MHISVTGRFFRIKLTNEFGIDSLKIGRTAIAIVNPHTLATGPGQLITFSRQASITIPPGAVAVSDPVSFQASALSDIAISIFVPAQMVRVWTRHDLAMQTNFEAPGNQVDKATLVDSKAITSWYLVKALDVNAPRHGAVIVAFGDSITDGLGSTRDANRRWPDLLAMRLSENRKTRNMSVLNLGISGNRILHDGTGTNALARFDRDVLTQSGVKYLIILEGINDIGRATREPNPEDIVSADDLAWGLSQLVLRAHQMGIKVFCATLTPAGRRSNRAEMVRAAFNQWIRTSGVFDGIVDFDHATLDPAHPTKFLPAFDSGDGLHPSDAGYAAMANSIDLSMFK